MDAACGGNGFVPSKLIKLGAKFVDCFDYNHFHKESIKRALADYEDKYKFYIQNLTKFDHTYSSKYDFVHCSGAIHHDKKYKKYSKLIKICEAWRVYIYFIMAKVVLLEM